MIARFWDRLFKMAEFYKEKSKESKVHRVKYETINEIMDILQDAWDEGESEKEEIFNCRPTTKAEVKMMDIPRLRVFKDTDGQVFYEIGFHHFDSAEEVIECAKMHNLKGKPSWKRLNDGTYERRK